MMNYFQAAVCLENQAPQLQGGWRLRENTLSKLTFQTARPSGAREAWVLLALPLQWGVGGRGWWGAYLSFLSCQKGGIILMVLCALQAC